MNVSVGYPAVDTGLVKVTPLGTLSVFSRDPEVPIQRRTKRHHGSGEMAASSVPKVQGIPNVPQVNLPDCVLLDPASSQGETQGLTSRRARSAPGPQEGLQGRKWEL